MAEALLDGTYAAVDAAIGTTTPVSLKCLFRDIDVDEQQGTIGYMTFCSSRWAQNRPGIRVVTGSLIGFSAKGSTYSAPGSLTSLGSPNPTITITFDTGCTRTFQCVFVRDRNGISAFGASVRVVEFVSDGPVTTTWVVV